MDNTMAGSMEAKSEPRSARDVLPLFARERKLVTLTTPLLFIFLFFPLFYHGPHVREEENEDGGV